MKNKYYLLQLFADAGTVVNVSTQTEEGYSMAPELKEFYDTELLENARVEMFYAQFAKRQPLPKNHGKTVEWRKWNTFEKASKLQEGVIPSGQKFGMTHMTSTIDQYGTYATISDTLELRAYDDVILGATEEMGASAAETQETLIRDTLMVNGSAMYAGQGDTSSTVIGEYLTDKDVAKAVAKLKKDRVPTIGGKYVAVIHPSVAHDLRQSEGWLEAHKYAAPEEIFNGEIGELHGCRFIENVYAPVWEDEATNGLVYSTFFFGKDAFGIIDPEGGALEMIIKDKSQIGGPLNQFSTVGYKFETNGAKVLYSERVLRLDSGSSFGEVDKPNYGNEYGFKAEEEE